jgi:hypothetical protein
MSVSIADILTDIVTWYLSNATPEHCSYSSLFGEDCVEMDPTEID